MRNPFRRRRPAPRTVTVTIEADTSGFLTGMSRVHEELADMRYRQRIAQERLQGLAFVGEQLDGLCEHFGMDPYVVWRGPRWAEEQARRERALWALLRFASLQVSRPVDGARIVGGVL